MWQNEFKNKESKKFKELSGQIEREFSDHSSFNQSREILNWHVSRLQQNKSEVIINLRVRTTAHMSPDQLLTMVLESNMNNTVIDTKELYFATTSIFLRVKRVISGTFVVFSHSSDVVANTGCAYNTENITDVNHTPMDHNTFFTQDSISNVIDQPVIFRKFYD